MSATTVYRKDTIRGRLQLRTKNQINPDLEDNFPIPVGALVEVTLPGESGTSVVLSTANTGEIDIVDADLSTVDFTCPIAKSELLLVGDAALDCIVTDVNQTPNVVTTFQRAKVLRIADRANPLP